MLNKLNREERLRLMKFVCSFAWADLEVREEERAFVAKLARKLSLDADEEKQVAKWLDHPPRADDLDPEQIPRAHRQLFLDAARAMVVVDGHVDHDEAENLSLLEMILEP